MSEPSDDPATVRPASQPEPSSPAESPLTAISSDDILQGKSEVLIRHGGELYRLRLTRNGKLILQK
jgi:hemin uptake protein HemP